MKGACEYAGLFKTGQYGRLCIVSGFHARGKTFRIFILPKGEDAIFNGPNNPPLNTDAIEVYGVISGQPGWSEEYGWLHLGKWADDFEVLLQEKIAEEKKRLEVKDEGIRIKEAKEAIRIKKLLETY